MTKALAAQGETQKSAEDLLSAVQKGSSADDLEKLLQDFNGEVNALLIQQNRPEYTYEKLIKALTENQIRLQEKQELLQQQIKNPSAPPEDSLGNIISIPFIISAVALLLVLIMFFVFRGTSNAQTKSLNDKQRRIDDLKSKVESLEREVKLLKATRPVENFNKPLPESRPAPKPNLVAEISPPPPPISPTPPPPISPRTVTLAKPPQPAEPPPRNPRAEKEKDFLKSFNALLAESKSASFRAARTEFLKKYQIKAFSCKNYEERMKNPSLAPEFASANSTATGDFWAYKVDNIYLVVPSPANSTYNDNLHLERAMGEVFDSNFTQGKTYDEIFVERAAVFLEGWKKENKGTLRLS